MRRHGWGGDIPCDDGEACSRILEAARALLADRPHTAPSISEVAERLCVTRQTVYRYFPSAQALLEASVADGIDDFLDAIAVRLAGTTDAAEAVVEGIAFTYEQIRRRSDLALLLTCGKSRQPQQLHEITSPASLKLGREILGRLPVDWEAAGYATDGGSAGNNGNNGTLDELVELMLRTLLSFVVDPGDPPRTPTQLRSYLRRWVGPAVRPPAGPR
jgi:AcrR family transcriptional regulator